MKNVREGKTTEANAERPFTGKSCEPDRLGQHSTSTGRLRKKPVIQQKERKKKSAGCSSAGHSLSTTEEGEMNSHIIGMRSGLDH